MCKRPNSRSVSQEQAAWSVLIRGIILDDDDIMAHFAYLKLADISLDDAAKCMARQFVTAAR